MREEPAPFLYEQERITALTSRVVRDRVFRRIVVKAYDARCAITGLKLINGGGRAEVEAAQIRPVAENGPDTVQNGLALSGTVHCMFDRGLISLSDELDILVSRQVNDPDGVWGLVNKTRRALAPVRAMDRPHPHFLGWHWEHCFKQWGRPILCRPELGSGYGVRRLKVRDAASLATLLHAYPETSSG